MRYIFVLLIASAPSAGCCSLMIAESGKDVSRLTTREQVHEEFGEPPTVGTTGGHLCDDYHTRRKIAEPMRSSVLGMSIAYSYGIGELFALPYEIYLLGRRTLLGQDLRFAYDDAGQVIRVSLDGEPLIPYDRSDLWVAEESAADLSRDRKKRAPAQDPLIAP